MWGCLILCVLMASPAAGQTCLGRLSFGNQPTQMQLEGSFAEGINGFSVGAAGGNARGFGGASIDFLDFELTPGIQDTAIGMSGFGAGVVRAGRVAICPGAVASYLFGPNIDLGNDTVEARVFGAQIGVRIGVPIVETETIQIIPTFGAGVIV